MAVRKLEQEIDTRDRTAGGSTRSVHNGTVRHRPSHALTTPIFQTATYTFANTQELVDFMEAKTWGDGAERDEYGRYGNPTIQAVEQRLAALDSGDDAVVYASGMNALTSLLLSTMPSGSHLVITDDCYRRSRQFCMTFLKRLNIETSVVPMGDYDAIEQAIIPRKTRFIISESPTNPYLRVMDMERIATLGQKYKVRTVIDSTLATPINQRPLEWGIDYVLHSATKYLAGHNDLLAGVVVGRGDRIKALRDARGILGGIDRSTECLPVGTRPEDSGGAGAAAEPDDPGGRRIPGSSSAHLAGMVSWPAVTSRLCYRAGADDRIWRRHQLRD